MSFENTLNYDCYLKYLDIKDSFSFEYKGIELKRVIASEILGLLIGKFSFSLSVCLKSLFIRFNTKDLIKAFNSGSVVFSSIYNSRNDHAELLKKIIDNVTDAITVNLNFNKYHPKINLYIYKSVFFVIKKSDKFKYFNFKKKFYLFSRLVFYCNILNELGKVEYKLNTDNKKYIPFLSSVGIEALLTLYFDAKRIKTFHIFHGIFGKYKIKIPNDIINGENINTKIILALSEMQKNDLINDFKIQKDRIFVAGNPKYPFKRISVKNTFKKCIVLNGFGFYDDDFIKLIYILNNVADKTGIIFNIKPHPNSKIYERIEIKNFKQINILSKDKLIKDVISKSDYDFAISYNTVTYYEVMYYNLICLRFGKNENLDFYGLDDRFYDEPSLLKLIDNYKNENLVDINKSVEDLLKYSIGMGINNYKKYLS